MELGGECLVGAGQRGHVEEVAEAMAPIEHDHAALPGEQPFDRIGEHGDGPAEAIGDLQPFRAEQVAEAVADADRARLQRDGAEVDQRILVVDPEDRRDPSALGGGPVAAAIGIGLDPVDARAAERRHGQADPVEDRPQRRALAQEAGAHEFTEEGFHAVNRIAVNRLINQPWVNCQVTQNLPVDNPDFPQLRLIDLGPTASVRPLQQ